MEQDLHKAQFNTGIQMDEAKAEELRSRLLQNVNVNSLIRAGNITADTVRRYPYRIQAWLDQLKPCIGCAGLKHCTQKTRGYCMNLRFDGMLSEEVTPCRYMKAKMLDEKHCGNYVISNLSPQLKTTSLKTVSYEGETEEYLKTVMELQDLYDEGKGAYIHGPMGTGKTYLASCAANDAARAGRKCAFLHYPTFVQKMQTLIRSGEWADTVKKMTYVDFLVIDDIGAESVTEWNRDQILQPILVYRYEHDLPTWFTSNYDPDTLKIHFMFSRGKQEQTSAERIMERILHMSRVVRLDGNDRRTGI